MDEVDKFNLLTIQINTMKLAMYVDSITTMLVHTGILTEEEFKETKEIYNNLQERNKDLKLLQEELEQCRLRMRKFKSLLN